MVEKIDISAVGKCRPTSVRAAARSRDPRPNHATALNIADAEHRAIESAIRLCHSLTDNADDPTVSGICMADAPSQCEPSEWMLDSGSGNDLIDFRVVASDADKISVGSSPLVLLTANGETSPVWRN